jgi:hypothetical protein
MNTHQSPRNVEEFCWKIQPIASAFEILLFAMRHDDTFEKPGDVDLEWLVYVAKTVIAINKAMQLIKDRRGRAGSLLTSRVNLRRAVLDRGGQPPATLEWRCDRNQVSIATGRVCRSVSALCCAATRRKIAKSAGAAGSFCRFFRRGSSLSRARCQMPSAGLNDVLTRRSRRFRSLFPAPGLHARRAVPEVQTLASGPPAWWGRFPRNTPDISG